MMNVMTLISIFLDGDVPRRPSYGVYISQLRRFVRVCSHVDDFYTRNKCLTAKQGYRYHKLRKAFFFQSFIADTMNWSQNSMSGQFRKVIMRYKRIVYNLNVMRQSACLVINPTMVVSFAALFDCTPVDRASDSMMAPT